MSGAGVLFAAWAAATSDRLEWHAPAGCPNHDDVAQALARDDGDDASPIDTHATVTATDAGKWRVVIVVRSATGELRRELELDSCGAAAEAVALVHALAVSQQEPADDPAPPPDPLPIPAPPSEPDPSPVATSSASAPVVTTPPRVRTDDVAPPPPRRRAPPALVLALAGGGGVGSLPRGGGHVMLGVGAQWRWLRLSARIDHAIVRRSTVADAGVGANVSTTTGGLALHVPIAAGPVTVLPGVDVRAGGMRARGTGGTGAVTRWVPWAIVGAGVDVVWMVGEIVGVRVGAEVEVPVVRHRFRFDALETAITQRVGGLFLAGVELRLPRGRGGRVARGMLGPPHTFFGEEAPLPPSAPAKPSRNLPPSGASRLPFFRRHVENPGSAPTSR